MKTIDLSMHVQVHAIAAMTPDSSTVPIKI